MIKYDSELRAAERRVAELEEQIGRVVKELQSASLGEAEITAVISEQVSELNDLREQIDWFNEAKHGRTVDKCSLRNIGRLLVSLRLSKGLSQQDLAAILKVTPAQISKDELKEYRGLSIERAATILDALEAEILLTVESGPGQETSEAEIRGTSVLADEPQKPVEPESEISEEDKPKPVEVPEQPTVVVPVGEEEGEAKVEEKKKVVLMLTVGCNSKTWGRGIDLKRAVSDIEGQVLAGANKLSGIEKFPEFHGRYEFVLSVSELLQAVFFETSAKQCDALAGKQKCWAKLDLWKPQ